MLRREDYIKRDVRKVGEEEGWKNKTRERRWTSLSDEAVKKLRAVTPDKRTKRTRER